MTMSNPTGQHLQGDFCSMPDHRQESRRRLSLPLTLILLAALDAPEIKVQVTDISTQGMGFRSRRTFGADQFLALRMPGVRGHERLVLCQIKHCRRADDDTCHTGVEFTECISLPTGSPVPPHWIRLALEVTR
jgi:hypothetical protein